MRDLTQRFYIKEKVNESIGAVHSEEDKLGESGEAKVCSALVSSDF